MEATKTCTACNEESRESLVSWNDGETTYTGRVNGANRWNGFAMPAFTVEEVRRMAADTRGEQGLYQITEQPEGSFLLTSEDDEPTLVIAESCCGLYFVGDWWVWAEVEKE
jgi:hypothetical protein